MFDFWENVLFHTGSYSRNPIRVHSDLNMLTPLKREHFEEWLRLWHRTVNELYEGPNAERIKQRASSIATVMQVNILDGGISRPRMSWPSLHPVSCIMYLASCILKSIRYRNSLYGRTQTNRGIFVHKETGS